MSGIHRPMRNSDMLKTVIMFRKDAYDVLRVHGVDRLYTVL
jgi:hypothetical protein